jgi:malate dehydrogenase (oxaloacetate-decarboxylating)(NADP+)
MESGVARVNITDWDAYVIELNKRLGLDNQLSRVLGKQSTP